MSIFGSMATTSVKASSDMDRSGWMYQSTPYFPSEWNTMLSAAGFTVTPEGAMALSSFYSGVTMIAADLAACPWNTYEMYPDGKGKDQVLGGLGMFGVKGLAYRLRWQPNDTQTSIEFFMSMVAQFLLRGVAYAEIVSGPRLAANEQFIPRHPDRVTPERLPSGRFRYKLLESDGQPRYVTQEEMLVVRDLSFDNGLTFASRTRFGAAALGSALAAQKAAMKFFKSGMTAGTVATYVGDMEPEDEDKLHASISRYASGVENSFGLMLIPDDVKITNLSVDPDKAQMMQTQEWGVKDVARLLRIPPSKLGVKDGQSYSTAVQEAIDYINTCLRPIAVSFEQAFQRDVIIRKSEFVVECELEALMRGDFEMQAKYYELFIKSRIMRPSEVRVRLNMNPDEALDELSAGDMRPGTPAGSTPPTETDGVADD